MRLPRKIDKQKYTTPDSRQIANLRLKHRITQSELANEVNEVCLAHFGDSLVMS